MYDQDFKIRMSKNIKQSLDIIRRKEHSSKGIIIRLEDKYKNELEKRYGLLLTQHDISAIMEQEESRNKNQKLAIDKARLKMLKLKEKINMIQLIRSNHNLLDQTEESTDPDASSDAIYSNAKKSRNENFKKFNISY